MQKMYWMYTCVDICSHTPVVYLLKTKAVLGKIVTDAFNKKKYNPTGFYQKKINSSVYTNNLTLLNKTKDIQWVS